MEFFPRIKSSLTVSAIEAYRMPESSVYSTSGLPRDNALPITTMSGADAMRCSLRYPL